MCYSKVEISFQGGKSKPSRHRIDVEILVPTGQVDDVAMVDSKEKSALDTPSLAARTRHLEPFEMAIFGMSASIKRSSGVSPDDVLSEFDPPEHPCSNRHVPVVHAQGFGREHLREHPA